MQSVLFSSLDCRQSRHEPSRARDTQDMKSLQPHLEAAANFTDIEAQAGSTKIFDDLCLGQSKPRGHGARGKVTRPGLFLRPGIELELERAVLRSSRWAQAQGEQACGRGCRRIGLDPTLEPVTPGQSMEPLHRGAQPVEAISHRPFEHRHARRDHVGDDRPGRPWVSFRLNPGSTTNAHQCRPWIVVGTRLKAIRQASIFAWMAPFSHPLSAVPLAFGDDARAAIPLRQEPRATDAEMLDAYSTAVTS